MKHKLDYFLLILFIILSALIRFTSLLRYDVPFLFDQGRDMLAVKQIVVDHKLTLIGPFTGLQGVFQSPLHFYLLAVPFLLSNGNPIGGNWMMALLALFGVFLCYFLGKRMIDRSFGLILALFFAFSPASMAFSSYFWNPNWIPFCMILFYYFLYKSIFTDNKFWILTGFITGIIAQFEVAFGLPLFISLFFLALLFKRNSFKTFAFWVIIPAFLLTFLPQMLFDIRHQFLMTKTILGFLHGANGGTGGVITFPDRFFYRINEIQQATLFAISNNKMIDYIILFPIILFPLFTIWLRQKKDLQKFFFFLFTPVFFFCIFLLYPHEAWSWYWIGLQTSYYCLLAFVLSTFMQHRQAQTGIIFSFLFLVVFLMGSFVPEIKGLRIVSQGDTGTLKNELRIIDFIYHDANKKSFGEFVYTPPIYDYAYQYLFWWKSQQYAYAPTKDKNGIFYLIIEPDPDHPYAINGWKETVIKTGKVIWDKKFPGKITVEKRIGK